MRDDQLPDCRRTERVSVNLLWVGGPAAAGKSTVSRLLARRNGLFWYSMDATAFDHETRAADAGLHVLGSGPGNFDRRPMILEDIRSLQVAALVEGAGVTPALAGVGGDVVWLLPSEAEQLARLERRHPDGFNEGLIWGRELINGQLESTAASVLIVDGQTVNETIQAVEQHFGPLLADLPAARSLDDRRALIRLTNRRTAAHLARRPQLAEVFDCECAQDGCQEFVDPATVDIPAALIQPFPSITAPEHSPVL